MAPKDQKKLAERKEAMKAKLESDQKKKQAALELKKAKAFDADIEQKLGTAVLKRLNEVKKFCAELQVNQQQLMTFADLLNKTEHKKGEREAYGLDPDFGLCAKAEIAPTQLTVSAQHYFRSHLSRVRDSHVPDWKKLIVDMKADGKKDHELMADMDKVWNDYLSQSRPLETLRETVPHEVNKLMDDFYNAHLLRDRKLPGEPPIVSPAEVHILKDIKEGEELYRCYNYVWLVMTYQHLIATVDQWDAGDDIIWRLCDVQQLRFGRMGCTSEQPPNHDGEGKPLGENMRWISKGMANKYAKLVRRFFCHMHKSLESEQERLRAKTVFNGIVVRVLTLEKQTGRTSSAKHVADLKC